MKDLSLHNNNRKRSIKKWGRAFHSIIINLPDEECEFLDTKYLSSKYPLGSDLPDYNLIVKDG